MRSDWRGNVGDGAVSFTENCAAKLDSAEISSMEICAVKIHMPKRDNAIIRLSESGISHHTFI